MLHDAMRIGTSHASTDKNSIEQIYPGAWPWQQNENSVQYNFYLLFMKIHTKFGIKIFEIDM